VLEDALGSAGDPTKARALERLLGHLDSSALSGLEGAA
jgi:hypothetical protein